MAAKIKDSENIIGPNIRRLRKQQSINCTQLARMVRDEGVTLSREALVKIEAGRQHIDLQQLNAICYILKVKYADILTEAAPW